MTTLACLLPAAPNFPTNAASRGDLKKPTISPVGRASERDLEMPTPLGPLCSGGDGGDGNISNGAGVISADILQTVTAEAALIKSECDGRKKNVTFQLNLCCQSSQYSTYIHYGPKVQYTV
jgi:hypothetical protein